MVENIVLLGYKYRALSTQKNLRFSWGLAFNQFYREGLSLVKKKGEKPRHEVTRRQLSRWQQQKRRQRIIFTSGILIIAAVLVLVGAGLYTTQYRPLHQTVIRVNDTEFDMNYYIKMLKYYGQGMPIQNMYGLADELVRAIQQNELIRQGALKLGISVSNDAIDEELKSRDPPLSKDYGDLVRAQLLMIKLHDEYFEQLVPIFAEQRHLMAMLLESESQATEVRARLEDGEDFAELAGELSLDGLSKSRNGDLDWQPKDILTIRLGTSILEEYAFSTEVGVLSQPIYDDAKAKNIGYWLVRVLGRDEETDEAQVHAMLLGSEEATQEVRDRLDAGEGFATLAKELSQLAGVEQNEGDLGWLSPGMVSSAFDEVVFDTELKLGTLSEPIRDETVITRGGYWLVKVIGIDDKRRVEDADRDLLKAKALNDWVSALWDNPKNVIESYLDAEKKAWAIDKVSGS